MICCMWIPDPGDGGWCLICNQGAIDAIILQSDNRQLLERNKDLFQPLYDRPLVIKPLVKVRTVEVECEEFFIPVGGPGDNTG